MDQPTFGAIIKKPSAFLPLAMSLTALTMLGSAYIFSLSTGHGGLVREPDEGAIAHLLQLLMAVQCRGVSVLSLRNQVAATRSCMTPAPGLQAGASRRWPRLFPER